MWTEILVSGASAPAARDGHTASIAGSKMIIFGGRGNASDSDSQAGLGTRTALLGDEWEIDLDLSQHVTVATNSSTVTIALVLWFPNILERSLRVGIAQKPLTLCANPLKEMELIAFGK